MIEVYSTGQTVAANAPVPLNNVALSKGCRCELSGTSTISLEKRGVYRVDVSASVIASSGGNIILQLAKNGSLQPQALAEETASDTTGVHSLSFSTLVQVPSSNCNCPCTSGVPIQIMNEGVAITVQQMDVTVTPIF